MKELFKFLPEVSKKISAAKGCLLMLDFDGTLSPLVKVSTRAFLPEKNKEILKKISRLIPTAIVSGRGLADIKQKIGIKGLIYAGNHGLEWQIGNRRSQIKMPDKMVAAINLTGRQLNNLCKIYPGAWLENKGLTLSLHYRLVNLRLAERLLKEAKRLTTLFQKQRLLALTEDKKTLEVRPALRWNKGYWVKFLRQKLGRQLLPIYIGDDATDEDAFKILRSGTTIKAGERHDSKANYHCRDTKEITLFLNWLLNKLLFFIFFYNATILN